MKHFVIGEGKKKTFSNEKICVTENQIIRPRGFVDMQLTGISGGLIREEKDRHELGAHLGELPRSNSKRFHKLSRQSG